MRVWQKLLIQTLFDEILIDIRIIQFIVTSATPYGTPTIFIIHAASRVCMLLMVYVLRRYLQELRCQRLCTSVLSISAHQPPILDPVRYSKKTSELNFNLVSVCSSCPLMVAHACTEKVYFSTRLATYRKVQLSLK